MSDLFYRGLAVYLAKTVAGSVVLDYWRGQGFIGFHSFRKGCFCIVATVLERASIEVADTGLRWRMRVDVVDVIAGRTDASASNAPEQLGLIDTDVDGHQWGCFPEDWEMSVEPCRLGKGAWKAIKDVAGMHIIAGETGLHHIIHDLVGNELPLIHQGFCRLSQFSSLCDVLAENIARRDLRNAEGSHQQLGLGSLAHAWSA